MLVCLSVVVLFMEASCQEKISMCTCGGVCEAGSVCLDQNSDVQDDDYPRRRCFQEVRTLFVFLLAVVTCLGKDQKESVV